MEEEASSFTPFPRLPTELRLKIWSHATHVRRVLELQFCCVGLMFFTFQNIPSILHTCREAREVGLQHYSLCFGTKAYPAKTYYNPEYDIVYFGSRNEHEFGDLAKALYKDAFRIDEEQEEGGAGGRTELLDCEIWNLALAQPFWHDRSNNTRSLSPRRPFASASSRSMKKFNSVFPHLKNLIVVEGREDRAFDQEDEVGQGVEAAWEDYDGIRLVEGKVGDEILDEKWAFGYVRAYFQDQRRAGRRVPEVVVMEYGFEGLSKSG